MKHKTVEQFVQELASSSPTPGGGSVSALVGSLAGALTCMVANLTLMREPDTRLQGWRDQVEKVYRACIEDIQRDAEAYEAVVAAQKLAKKTPEEKLARTEALQTALKKAAQVPFETGQHVLEILELAAKIAPHARSGYVSDLGVANFLALSTMMSAAINVETNLHAIHDATFVKDMGARLVDLETRAHTLFGDIETAVKDRMAPTA